MKNKFNIEDIFLINRNKCGVENLKKVYRIIDFGKMWSDVEPTLTDDEINKGEVVCNYINTYYDVQADVVFKFKKVG